MVEAALLELEGVVFDTRELRRLSVRDALVEHGLMVTLDIEAIDGWPTRHAVEASLARQRVPSDPVLVDLVTMRAERAFSSRLATSGAALCPGARQFIESAASATRLAVVSRARRGDADTMLRLASLADAFTTVVTADDLIDGKPSGEGHRLAIERLSRRRTITARQSIALEHGVAGIRAARDAGIRCVAAGVLAAHVAMEADAYVPSLEGVTMRTIEDLIRAGEGEGLPQ